MNSVLPVKWTIRLDGLGVVSRWLLLAVLLLSSPALLAQNTWNGSQNTTWSTAANWSANAAPTAADDVVIPSGTPNQPTLSGSGVAKTVEVKSGATLTIAATGTLTINGSKWVTGYTMGFFNGGTVENGGQLSLGTTASVGQIGLRNQGIFNNSGQIAIDSSTAYGLHNQSGTFTNTATITIGAKASVGFYSLVNEATFQNNAGGQVILNRSTGGHLFNYSGTFTNAATITIGAAGNVGDYGLVNYGTFQNNAGGQIAIDRAKYAGLFNYTGTFTNAATITIGAVSSVGDYGLINQATFNNNAGGHLATDNSTKAGLVNESGNFTNAAQITIGASSSPGVYGFANISSGTFQNNAGGRIAIDRSTAVGLYNQSGTFTNAAEITIGANNSVGQVDLYNQATFNNNTGGQIALDRSTAAGLYNQSGAFTNAATIAIGAKASVGSNGLANEATFNNNVGGQITIDRSTASALYTGGSSTFTNAAKITIGANSSVGLYGIANNATFNNNAGGQIALDNSTTGGLGNAGTFTNAATITIGANANVGTNGVLNQGTFNNSGCGALLNVVANAIIFNDSGKTFTNSGTILENASGNSTISSNTGIVVNGNGGTFTVGSGPNQPLAVTTASPTSCVTPNGSITLTGLKASTPYTLRYTVDGTTTLLSPDSTSTASGELTIPGLGAGTYTLTLSGNCLPTTLTLKNTLNSPIPPAVSITGLEASYCQNAAAVILTGTPVGGTFTVAGQTATRLDPASLTPGEYEIVYTYTDGNGCTNSAKQKVTILPTGLTQQASLSSGPVCAGQAITLGFGFSCPGSTAFTAQLSDASGSFASPIPLGSVNPGSQGVVIPISTPGGSGYRIRVLGDAVALDTTATFTVNALDASALKIPTTPARLCLGRGEELPISFATPGGTCPFGEGNVFTVQLSNATGSFTKPTVLGTITPGTSNYTLPAGLSAGTGYRVRVVSSSPALTSAASVTFKLEDPSLSVTPTVGSTPVCRGGQVSVGFNLPAGGCPFPEGNVFTAQLSSATGSFNNPINLGVVTPGQSSVSIPVGTATGNGYRIRIVSSNPAVISLSSAPIQVKTCNSRLSAEEASLVVAPNPVVRSEIRCRVAGMDNPVFSLTTITGRSLEVAARSDGSGEHVLTPRQVLAAGVYLLQASEGTARLTQRVLVSE